MSNIGIFVVIYKSWGTINILSRKKVKRQRSIQSIQIVDNYNQGQYKKMSLYEGYMCIKKKVVNSI